MLQCQEVVEEQEEQEIADAPEPTLRSPHFRVSHTFALSESGPFRYPFVPGRHKDSVRGKGGSLGNGARTLSCAANNCERTDWHVSIY